MLDPTYPLFPILSFLGFVLALLPLPWHLQAWNAGTCCYMIWSSLACLLEFVNSVAWKDNAINFAPVWCDISSKLLLGAGIGIPASSLCISRRLYNIAAVQATSNSRQDKRRALIGDLCIAVGLPVLVMVLHYVVQGHRFDILEQVGCTATIYDTIASYFLVFLWPVFIGCISSVYSALTLRAFYKRRIQFAQLVSSNSSMSMNRYLKLIVLASTEIICTVPISAYSTYITNVGLGLSPYISWSNVHFGFSYVGQVPALEWRSNHPQLISIELSRWLFPACALLFFALFGLGADARRHYVSAFWMIAKRFGVTSAPTKTSLPLSSRWQFTPKLNPLTSSVGSLTAYTSSRPTEMKLRSPSVVSSFSFGGTDACEDVEKSAGQASPTSTTYPSSPTSAGFTSHNEEHMSSEGLVSPALSHQRSLPIVHYASASSLAPTVPPKDEPTSGAAYQRPFTGPGVVPLTSTTPFFPPPPRRTPRRVLSGPLRVMVHTTELYHSD